MTTQLSVERWLWGAKDPRTGRWNELAWMMAEAEAAEWARKNGTSIARIEGSREVRTDVDGRH